MKTCTIILFFFVHIITCQGQDPGAYDFYNDYFNGNMLTRTNYGLVIKKTSHENQILIHDNRVPVGSNYAHIFFDENGNLISENIPNGIPWVNYVIHIIYQKKTGVSYSAIQNSGRISGTISIKNAPSANASELIPGEPQWTESISVLRQSDNTDITFQLIKTAVNSTGTTKSTIGTYTLPLSGYYNASVDLGVLNSTLSNPVYSVVNSTTVPGAQVVKATGNGNRVMTTIMGTIYFSPIIFLEKAAFNLDVPDFKLKGRSAVEDAHLFERIYPAFGLSINEKTFQNIFYGLNWEIFPGGSLFAGFHTGKINSFENTPDFKLEQTPVTQDEFNLRTNNKWATKFALGATIDLRVVLGLINNQIK